MAGKGPTVTQAIVLVLCGASLAFFGCLGLYAAMNGAGESVASAALAVLIVGLTLYLRRE